MLDLICGYEPKNLDFRGHSNIEKLEYASYIHGNCKNYVSNKFIEWLKALMKSDDYKKALSEFVALDKLISAENPGEMRSELLKQQRILEKKYKS